MYLVSALISPVVASEVKIRTPNYFPLLRFCSFPTLLPHSTLSTGWRRAQLPSFPSYASLVPACFRRRMTANSLVQAQTVKKIACIGAGYVGGPSTLPPSSPPSLAVARFPHLRFDAIPNSTRQLATSPTNHRTASLDPVHAVSSSRSDFFAPSSRSASSVSTTVSRLQLALTMYYDYDRYATVMPTVSKDNY